MYLSYFGLRESPFNVTSDPHFLFLSHQHQETLSHLLYGINERKGFLEITGDVGTGKTTLCRALLDQLDEQIATALVLNPELSATQLLQAILDDFGETPAKRSKYALMGQINAFLLKLLDERRNAVIILDEAQNLKRNVLEQIRMLSNLETTKEKLVQIVLVGQPELHTRLLAPDLQQLYQRIAVRFHLRPLPSSDVETYVRHRLDVAGSDGRVTFTQDAIEAVYQASGGVPRLINLICDKALLAAFVSTQHVITGELIQRACTEWQGSLNHEHHSRRLEESWK